MKSKHSLGSGDACTALVTIGVGAILSISLKGGHLKSGDKVLRKMKPNDATISDRSQRELAVGVLKQVAEDLRRYHKGTSKVERTLYFDAYSWVISEDYSWPFSFPNVCQILKRPPEDLRRELLGDLAFGSFGQWIRRFSRAVRRLRDSFTERVVPEYNLSPAMPARLAQTWH